LPSLLQMSTTQLKLFNSAIPRIPARSGGRIPAPLRAPNFGPMDSVHTIVNCRLVPLPRLEVRTGHMQERPMSIPNNRRSEKHRCLSKGVFVSGKHRRRGWIERHKCQKLREIQPIEKVESIEVRFRIRNRQKFEARMNNRLEK
jgi:hypothetical protein